MTVAHEQARAAAQRHGLSVRLLDDIAEHHAVADLLCRIWRADSPDAVLNAGLIRAFAHSGNYVAGAYAADVLLGAAVGFFGADHLHSHVAGVDPERQGKGVGYALKLHQRAWALDRGITTVTWTFDPLVRRNAYFNLHKLGASASAYLPDFYGPMTDGLNAGDASDRLYISWLLTSPRAQAAADGDTADVPADLLATGVRLLDRDGDEPGTVAPVPATATPVLVAVPPDIEGLRLRDPALAGRWRYAVREALITALDAGRHITGMAREGYYVLEVHG